MYEEWMLIMLVEDQSKFKHKNIKKYFCDNKFLKSIEDKKGHIKILNHKLPLK